MYIKNTRSYYESDGTQHAGRQWFLILVQDENEKCGPDNMRAIVRKVALEQCGHFMMGYARAFGHKLILSGSYGSDGLPKSVPSDVFDRAVPLPSELYDAWNHGGGWNSAGNEAKDMRQWAIDNFEQLAPNGAEF